MSKHVLTVVLTLAFGFLSFRDTLVSEPRPDGSAVRMVDESGSVTCQVVSASGAALEAGQGLMLTGGEISLDTDFTDARYLMTDGGGVVDGDLTVNATTFVGINRSNRISSFEAFGILARLRTLPIST